MNITSLYDYLDANINERTSFLQNLPQGVRVELSSCVEVYTRTFNERKKIFGKLYGSKKMQKKDLELKNICIFQVGRFRQILLILLAKITLNNN